LGWCYGQYGRLDLSRAVFEELKARSLHEFVAPAWLAITAGAANLPDEAIARAEKAVAERDPHILWVPTFPFWDSIREHPRFNEIMRGVWD
jgi:hypothetical protein